MNEKATAARPVRKFAERGLFEFKATGENNKLFDKLITGLSNGVNRAVHRRYGHITNRLLGCAKTSGRAYRAYRQAGRQAG